MIKKEKNVQNKILFNWENLRNLDCYGPEQIRNYKLILYAYLLNLKICLKLKLLTDENKNSVNH